MAAREHTALIVDGKQPSVAPTAWIAPTAVLAGAVTVEEEASIWYTAVLRADRLVDRFLRD